MAAGGRLALLLLLAPLAGAIKLYIAPFSSECLSEVATAGEHVCVNAQAPANARLCTRASARELLLRKLSTTTNQCDLPPPLLSTGSFVGTLANGQRHDMVRLASSRLRSTSFSFLLILLLSPHSSARSFSTARFSTWR